MMIMLGKCVWSEPETLRSNVVGETLNSVAVAKEFACAAVLSAVFTMNIYSYFTNSFATDMEFSHSPTTLLRLLVPSTIFVGSR